MTPANPVRKVTFIFDGIPIPAFTDAEVTQPDVKYPKVVIPVDPDVKVTIDGIDITRHCRSIIIEPGPDDADKMEM